MSAEILPLLYDENRNPRNPRLVAMVEAYIERASGKKVDLSRLGWSWAAVEGGEHVTGVVALANTIDVPVFHVESSRETLMLYRRAIDRLIDNGVEGHGFVYVNPAEAEKWNGFMERIGAEPANRFRFPICPSTKI